MLAIPVHYSSSDVCRELLLPRTLGGFVLWLLSSLPGSLAQGLPGHAAGGRGGCVYSVTVQQGYPKLRHGSLPAAVFKGLPFILS